MTIEWVSSSSPSPCLHIRIHKCGVAEVHQQSRLYTLCHIDAAELESFHLPHSHKPRTVEGFHVTVWAGISATLYATHVQMLFELESLHLLLSQKPLSST